jgi:hypothetical protein
MKSPSNNLAISLSLSLSLSLYYIFLILGEMMETLLDGLGLPVKMQFMLNQHTRNSRHVSRLPCKDVSIFLKEFDECKFLFGV